MIVPPNKSNTRRLSCCLILLVMVAFMLYPFLVTMEDYCIKKKTQSHEVIHFIEGYNISLVEMLTPTIIDSGNNSTVTKSRNTSIAALRRQLLRRTHVTAALLDEQKLSTEIPKIIYQTYHHPEEIPPKVAANLAKYASDYQRYVLDDDMCIDFLTKHYHEAVIKTFGLLGGAHKADLFRYAILYLKGGVYLDIKTELLMPLENVFPPKSPGPRGITYTAIDAVGTMLYQGIIASPKGNPAFLYGIQEFVQSQKPVRSYFMSTDQMYKTIGSAVGSSMLKPGLNSVLQSNSTIAADLLHKYTTMSASSSSNSSSSSNIQVNKTVAPTKHERTRARGMRLLLGENSSNNNSISTSSTNNSSTNSSSPTTSSPTASPTTSSPTASSTKIDTKIDIKGENNNRNNSNDSSSSVHGRNRIGSRKTNDSISTIPPATSSSSKLITTTAATSATTTATATTTTTMSSAAIANNLYQFDYFLFQERGFPAKECYDGVDRYGGCNFICRGDQKVLKVRYADYPWHPKPFPQSLVDGPLGRSLKYKYHTVVGGIKEGEYRTSPSSYVSPINT